MTSSRFRQIADDLHERVALGEFGDQGALDSESALCARYTVSRVTVRRALETLREQGLVESRQGSGWFATGGSFHQTLALGTFRHAGSAVAESGKAMTRRVVEFGYRQASPALASTLGLVADADPDDADPDAVDPDADANNADKTDAAKVAESEAL
ncbi:MAG: GntR family transcriptional regulator, partial [Dermatophilaceae bacterium]